MTLAKWDTYHCYGMTLMTLGYFLLPSIALFTGFSLISFSFLWFSHWKDIRHLKPPGGYPNYVTLVRLGGLLSVTAISPSISDKGLALILLILVLLDGVDGYLARRLNQRTEFGGIFDMETDALFVCIIACMLLEKGILPGWILVPAFIKYHYTVLAHLTRLNKGPEQRSLFGATVAVIMFFALIVALLLPEKPGIIIAGIASVLICISFLNSLIGAVILRLKNL